MANINAPPQLPHLPPLPVPRGTFAGEKKHPSRGGNPYSDDFRLDVIMRYQLGLPLVTDDELNALRAVYAYPSMSSCRRYINKHNVLLIFSISSCVRRRMVNEIVPACRTVRKLGGVYGQARRQVERGVDERAGPPTGSGADP